MTRGSPKWVVPAWFMAACFAAGVLMLPYWGWVSFAAALNFQLWRLNP